MNKISCGCPVHFSAKMTTRTGKVIYAKSVGKRCFPFVIHEQKCPHRKDKDTIDSTKR